MSYEYEEKKKGKKFTMILSPEQAEMLETLAETLGKNQKEVILEALELYAQGKLVDLTKIRGDQILATLVLFDRFIGIQEKINKMLARATITSLAEQITSTKELIDALKKIGLTEAEIKQKLQAKEEKEEKSGSEELLAYVILGALKKLGLADFIEFETE